MPGWLVLAGKTRARWAVGAGHSGKARSGSGGWGSALGDAGPPGNWTDPGPVFIGIDLAPALGGPRTSSGGGFRGCWWVAPTAPLAWPVAPCPSLAGPESLCSRTHRSSEAAPDPRAPEDLRVDTCSLEQEAAGPGSERTRARWLGGQGGGTQHRAACGESRHGGFSGTFLSGKVGRPHGLPSFTPGACCPLEAGGRGG